MTGAHAISGIRLAGVAASIPQLSATLEDLAVLFSPEEARKISDSVGVQTRHIAPPRVCTSDLCHGAAGALIKELAWDPASIDALIFVSQTPDYILPATACCLQQRLGLSKHCAAFDVNLGCSGYIYGLWIAASLLASGSVQRALVVCGDTSTHWLAPNDRSVVPLFGDAGAATALERGGDAGPMVFQLGTDGSGRDHLIIPAGGNRLPFSPETARRTEREGGNRRSDQDLFMNGAEIFAFSLREVPGLIQSVLSAAGWSLESTDSFVMHQANRFMLEHLARRIRIPAGKMVIDMKDFGNTSSASVPLAMAHTLRDRLRAGPMRLVLAGFGVGFSWGALALSCGPIAVPEIAVLTEPSSVPV